VKTSPQGSGGSSSRRSRLTARGYAAPPDVFVLIRVIL
jgi:hypothetical protein